MANVGSALKNIFRIKELRSRIFITLTLLLVTRLGVHIILPGVDIQEMLKFKESMKDQPLYMYMNVFSGGGIGNMALFALGIMPYITSSIIMQLMSKTSKRLEAITKEGPAGQRKISQYTRLLTLPIALIQSIFIVNQMGSMFVSDAGVGTFLLAIMGMCAGAIFIMWIGEQISEFGIGNGASLIIMIGIIANIPAIFGMLYDRAFSGEIGYHYLLVLFILFCIIITAVVYITQAQRRIPIQHARQYRGRRMSVGQKNYLPMKLNQAGVMPVIFASALTVIPLLLSMATGSKAIQNAFSQGSFLYVLSFVLMIYFFSYFWTYLFFQPVEMANNLKEHGSFIPGIRPGQRTAEYLYGIVNKVTLCGATFLCVIALLPSMLSGVMPKLNSTTLAFLGGTGILIVVGVGLDLIQKIESYLLVHHYDGFVEGGTVRGRR